MTLQEAFDQLDWQAVSAFIDQKQEENLHLDFKLVANSELSHKDDKRNFSKGLSGFANSSGGIIVWGVDARKNADGVDCATSVAELTNAALMVTRLNSLTGDATSPPVDGVMHKAVINPATGRGVAATLVPENDAGPFMAKLGEQRYFKRSGDSFYQMEHFDLEDMFGRRRKPKLQLTIEMVHTENENFNAVPRLVNSGRAIARYAGLVLRFENVEIVDSGTLQNVTALNDGRPIVQYHNDIGVIHPNGIRINIGTVRLRRLNSSKRITAHATVYCENMRTIDIEYELVSP